MPMQVEVDLARAREEFHTLSMHLQEIAPNHTITFQIFKSYLLPLSSSMLLSLGTVTRLA